MLSREWSLAWILLLDNEITREMHDKDSSNLAFILNGTMLSREWSVVLNLLLLVNEIRRDMHAKDSLNLFSV